MCVRDNRIMLGRCKSERLQEFCLNNAKIEKDSASHAVHQRKRDLRTNRERLLKDMNQIESFLSKKMGAKWFDRFRSHLSGEDPVLCSILFPDTTQVNGFNVAGKDGKTLKEDSIWTSWCDGKPAPTKVNHPIWQLSKDKRAEKRDEWEEEIKKPRREKLLEVMAEVNSITKELDELYDVSRQQYLANADIVACTTSGAARDFEMISKLNLPVLMIEEAGELLESHVLTALSPACEHLIMIGDHKQLRPKVEFYPLQKESGRGHDFNVSLFERLASILSPATLHVRWLLDILSFTLVGSAPDAH
jgi:hypothetical protein